MECTRGQIQQAFEGLLEVAIVAVRGESDEDPPKDKVHARLADMLRQDVTFLLDFCNIEGKQFRGEWTEEDERKLLDRLQDEVDKRLGPEDP